MLHEIQPGDVAIVTVPTMPVTDDPIKEMLDGKANGMTVYCPNATETSVHVIRAKKAEDKPEPDWTAWRDVKAERPPTSEAVLLWNDLNELVHLGVWKESLGCRHWMPLPEGPKS